MTRDEFMEVAWADFLRWAIEDADMRAAFEAETALRFPVPAGSAIERLIDEATGYDQQAPIVEFVRWATVEYWGLADAPKAYREALEAGIDAPLFGGGA